VKFQLITVIFVQITGVSGLGKFIADFQIPGQGIKLSFADWEQATEQEAEYQQDSYPGWLHRL
jgi:hypothetical protein